ncbi:hypothetical protein NE237_008472 [Protea cynaroides]|uniref:Uncharacterized protein n=1 Tax=Protea cynaroides TaxID=273540 RepID=A0A9Q0KVN8_9MAGN|nr:hypothetical protein NE237_008472 [Protea cynaroides]
MGFDAIRKDVILSIRNIFRWVGSYIFILGLVVFSFLLYRFLPSVFSFLLSSSPVVVCTFVLLQALFSFGHPNVRKDEKKEKEKEKDDNFAEILPPSLNKSSGFCLRHAETSVKGLHQHRDPGLSYPSTVSLDDSYTVSECSMESNDGSGEMEDEAGRLEDGVKPVEWTEEDEKNLMELGTSELERNQRLENLIEKRSARKLWRIVVEKDLLDFDNNELHQIPAITTKRNDPLLAASFNPNDVSGLPPIPSSAPSFLLSTRNPFDITSDPVEEKLNLKEDSFQEEFMAVQQKNVHFSRHGSFCLGPSFMGQPKRDILDINLAPFFVTQQITSQSVMGSGYPSSVADLGEQDLSQEGSLISDTGFVPESFEQESQASNEVVYSNFKDIEQEDNLGVEIAHETDSESTTADTGEAYVKPEVPRKYEGFSSSPSEEAGDDENEKIFHINKDEGLENLSCHIVEGTDSNQREEPHYDLNASSIDKKTIKESLCYEDKGVILTTTSSIASDLQVEISQAGSPSSLLDRTLSIEELSSGSEMSCDASSHLRDGGNESRSNKVTKSSEVETTRSGLSGDSDNQAPPHVVLETVVVQQVSPDSSLNSVAVEHVSINTTLSSSPPMDQVPSATSDPNRLLDEKEKAEAMACNYSDALSHEGLTYPFKVEVSSGNEVQYGTSSHPSGDENELRSNKITQSSELETTKVSFSGGSDDPAAPHALAEPLVIEQILSYSLPESMAVEKSPTDMFSSPNTSMDQVPLAISNPKIPVDEEKEKPVPLMEEPIVQPPPKGVHEQPQAKFLMEKPSLNGEENESRSNKTTQSSELETTEVGFSGVSDDPAAQHAVPEPVVVEQVFSYSLPESVAIEKAPTDMFSSPYPSMDQVPLLISNPNIPVDEEKEKPVPLMVEPIVRQPSKGGHEEPQTQFVTEKPSFHGEENESRSNKFTQSSELATTKAGFSGGSDDPAAPHVVPEPMVVEKVSSYSFLESVAVDQKAPTDMFSSPYASMDQVPLPISNPKIHVDEEKGKRMPLMEEPIVQPLPKGVHEDHQTQFLMEKPSLNGEEPQEQSTVSVNSTEETNIIPSRND